MTRVSTLTAAALPISTVPTGPTLAALPAATAMAHHFVAMMTHLSLSMMEKLTGHMNPFEEVPLNFKGNTVTADFTQKIKNSDLGKTTILGYNLADSLQIDGAVPHNGYVEFQTNLQVPDDVKNLLLKALQ